MNIGAVQFQVIDITAQPNLKQFRADRQDRMRVFDETRPVELPVILAMKDVRGFYMTVGKVDRSQLTQFRAIDENLAVRFPMLGHSLVNRFIPRVLGDEHFTNRRGIGPVKAFQRKF
ncbi:hypothetical protein D3C79_976390 [compost metagenome]